MPTKRAIDRLLIWTQQRIKAKHLMEERLTKLLHNFPYSINFKIIKIAGTNGKGSVSAMLSSCLTSDNQSVGMFTSPHLVNVTERFRVNDQEINEAELEILATEVEAWLFDFVQIHGTQFTPTFFDVLILIAIAFFEKNKVAIAIFEAGVGGSNDATSYLPDTVSAITSIGLDHVAQLGNTLESVAKDKAGIAQSNSTLILSSSINDPLKEVIKKEIISKNITLVSTKNRRVSSSFSLEEPGFSYLIDQKTIQLQPSLKGHFQLRNLDLVIEIWRFLLSKKIVHRLESLQAVRATKWNARFEIIKKNPTWIFDAAHNEHALKALIISLDQMSNIEDRVLILGISKEKDAKKMLPIARQISKTVFLVDDFYKSTNNEVLINLASNIDFEQLESTKILKVINEVSQVFSKKIIVVTGSIFMIGQARNQLLNE